MNQIPEGRDRLSEAQNKFLSDLAKQLGVDLPRDILSHPTPASNWISVAKTLRKMRPTDDMDAFKKSDQATELWARCRSLAAYYAFQEPSELTRASLLNWLRKLGRHVKAPPQDRLLAYWKHALAYCDLDSLVSKSTEAAEAFAAASLPHSLPRARGLQELSSAGAGQPTALLMACCQRGPRWSALLAIPLEVDFDTGAFRAVSETAPFFNRQWLEPADPEHPMSAYFSSVEQCEAAAEQLQPPGNESWPEYWRYVEGFVRLATDRTDDLLQLASWHGLGNTHWRIVPWRVAGAVTAVDATYERVLQGKEAPLLRTLISAPATPAEFGEAQSSRLAHRLTGHMDTYHGEAGSRGGPSLDASQRAAATALIAAVPEHQLLTVNGPPGSGKTSFLRAVIATTWVDAALGGGTPPIVLATAATNKAVTNIIESFAAIAGPAELPDWTSRWLPDLHSYGWFFPASSHADDKFPDFMLLRRTGANVDAPSPYAMAGTASDFAVAAQEHHRGLTDQFLEKHRQCEGLPQPLATPALAAESIRDRLAASVKAMRDLQRRFAAWLETATSQPTVTQAPETFALLQAAATQSLAVAAEAEQQALLDVEAWSDVLSHVAEAEAVEAEGRRWWARLWRGLVADRWTSRARQARLAALVALTRREPAYVATDVLSSSLASSRLQAAHAELAQASQAHTRARQDTVDLEAGRARAQHWRAEADALWRASGPGPAGGSGDWRARAAAPPFDGLYQTFEAALDQQFRFVQFHMTARYWEARWLADPATSADAANPLKGLQRAAMLAPVIVATVYTLPRIHDALGFADLLIFDEAGQASPELGASAFAFARRALVVGDTAQLRPVWSLDRVANLRLVRDLDLEGVPQALSSAAGSLMETAQRVTAFSDPSTGDASEPLGHGVSLRAHYRCRKDIINFCRDLVYGDRLQPERHEQPPFLYPAMAWVAVTSLQGAQPQSSSWVNHDEVAEIVRWLRHDGPRLVAHYGAARLADIVAVLAPFRAQAQALQKEIDKVLGDSAAGMVINTVHALQGAEKPVVAFSLTQTEGRFFVERDGPNLLNVAVSRAKDTFVLFAASSVLSPKRRKDGVSSPLLTLIDYLRKRGQRLYPRECVIIEAPGKREVVEAALGLSARVIATGGHFRDLKDGPTGLGFTRTDARIIEDLRTLANEAGQYDRIYLATDDDDDGEEIAWHIAQVLGELGAKVKDKLWRMRFHALAPGEIRRARELALPGIDARRVRSSLLRKLAEQRLHAALRMQGVSATRPQLATLRELDARAQRPVAYGVRVHGRQQDAPVRGWLVEGSGVDASPRLFDSINHARIEADQLAARRDLPVHSVVLRALEPEVFPPNTTAQVLVAAHRALGWEPERTRQALSELYLGKALPQAFGSAEPEPAA